MSASIYHKMKCYFVMVWSDMNVNVPALVEVAGLLRYFLIVTSTTFYFLIWNITYCSFRASCLFWCLMSHLKNTSTGTHTNPRFKLKSKFNVIDRRQKESSKNGSGEKSSRKSNSEIIGKSSCIHSKVFRQSQEKNSLSFRRRGGWRCKSGVLNLSLPHGP